MELVTSILMALWLWEFTRNYLSFASDWFIHLTLVPGLAYLSWKTPTDIREVLAIAGGLLLIQLLTNRSLPATRTSVKKRTSNIPPPP